MKTKTDLNVLKNNTIMLYILQISNYVFPLITFPYLTRVLQPEYYGIMTFANGVMVYFRLLIDFGFLQSATKDCSLYRNDKSKLSQILASTVQAKFILGFFGLGIIMILLFFTEIFNGREVYILLAYIPVFLSVFSIDYLFRGLEIMKIITYRTLVGRAIYTVLIFIFVHKPEQYLMIPVISAIGEGVILIWAWIYVKRKLGISVTITSFSETLAAFKESSLFFLSRIASTAYTSTNIVILGIIYNNALVAQFGVANALINNIRSLFSPIADSIYPYMIQKKNYKLVKKILIVLTPIILLGTIGLYFLADPIIMLMAGKQYDYAIPIFRAFLPMIVITLPVFLLGFPVLGAMNRMKDANLSVIFAAIYHIIGLFTLYYLDMLNFISVALLTCTTEMVILIYRLIVIKKSISYTRK